MKNFAVRVILFLCSSILLSLYSGPIFLGMNIYFGVICGVFLAFILLLYSIFFNYINKVFKSFLNCKIGKILIPSILVIIITYSILFIVALTNTIICSNYSNQQIAECALAIDLYIKPSPSFTYSYTEAKNKTDEIVAFLVNNPNSNAYICNHKNKIYDNTIADYFKNECNNKHIDFDKRCFIYDIANTEEAIELVYNDSCFEQKNSSNSPCNINLYAKEYKIYRCLLFAKKHRRIHNNHISNFHVNTYKSSWNIFLPKITDEAIKVVNNYYLKGIF